MSGSNNFLQWNPSLINQQSDAQYLTEVMRTGGAISGIYPSVIANKLYYQCSIMAYAIGEMMSNKGYAVSDADAAALVTVLANLLTKADFGTGAGTVCQGNDSRLNPEFAAGTKLWFYQNTAPTGWTIDATVADAILAVKGGTQAYNATGGAQAGTWTQPNHLHSTGDVTLTAAQSGLPAHLHPLPIGGGGSYTGVGSGITPSGIGADINSLATANYNASQAHNHGNTGNSATANTWRSLANVGIICTKD